MPEPVTMTTVRTVFEDAGAALVGTGAAEGFEITEGDGILIAARRKPDGQEAVVGMTATTEVFLLDLGGLYRDHGTAYDDDDKWATLADFLERMRLFLERNYHEEIDQRNGRTVRRTITLGRGDAGVTMSTPVGLADRLRLLLGTTRTVVRP
jgi:hypothetical protein